jgi:Lon protease-like protein
MRALTTACLTVLLATGAPALVTAQDQPPPAELPAAIPLFPLPDVTLFPHITQPFHIFEPRYRSMVEDALAGDSIIGMVQLRPGYEEQYEGRPPVYAIGCAGVIVASERLPDGRYNILVRGVTKFRILGEDQSRLYRLADVENIPESIDPGERPLLTRRRRQLEEALRSSSMGSQLPPADAPDEEVIDGLSLILPLAPAQRQQLLEANGPLERALVLVGFLRGQSQAE